MIALLAPLSDRELGRIWQNAQDPYLEDLVVQIRQARREAQGRARNGQYTADDRLWLVGNCR